jgi:hypothetical protein
MVLLALTSRSGRIIKPFRRVKESLNEVLIESKNPIIPTPTVVTCFKGGKK